MNEMEDYKKFNYEVFKKWRKSANSAGFMSVKNWPYAEKVIVEIAETDPNTNAIKSLSKCFLPTTSFISYLHAEVHGLIPRIYPTLLLGNDKHGVTFFGGKQIARVFKIEDWAYTVGDANKVYEPSSNRRFKAGEFDLLAGGNASAPDYKKPLNRNSIMMRPNEISELYHKLMINEQAFRSKVIEFESEQYSAESVDPQEA